MRDLETKNENVLKFATIIIFQFDILKEKIMFKRTCFYLFFFWNLDFFHFRLVPLKKKKRIEPLSDVLYFLWCIVLNCINRKKIRRFPINKYIFLQNIYFKILVCDNYKPEKLFFFKTFHIFSTLNFIQGKRWDIPAVKNEVTMFKNHPV